MPVRVTKLLELKLRFESNKTGTNARKMSRWMNGLEAVVIVELLV